MKLDRSKFNYQATIKLGELPKASACGIFPGVVEIGFSSREFRSYGECVSSAKLLMEDVVKDVNTQLQQEQFTVCTEINPTYTGIETRSQDWAQAEMSRFWIFAAAQTGAKQIHAVGQARIFALGSTPRRLPTS